MCLSYLFCFVIHGNLLPSRLLIDRRGRRCRLCRRCRLLLLFFRRAFFTPANAKGERQKISRRTSEYNESVYLTFFCVLFAGCMVLLYSRTVLFLCMLPVIFLVVWGAP